MGIYGYLAISVRGHRLFDTDPSTDAAHRTAFRRPRRTAPATSVCAPCPVEADAVLRRVLAATGLGPTGWIGESYGIHASVMLNLSWEQMEVCIKVACRQVNQLECHRC